MKVLMITGDKRMLEPGTEAYERAELQRAQVEKLDIVYWGRGSLWPALPRRRFDVVTVQDPFWRGLFGMLNAWRRQAKLNVQVHTDLSAQSLTRHMLAQIVLRHADSVRVVSQTLKAQVERIGVRAKITVLPVYVDVSRFQNLVHTSHPQKTILWVGRFEPEKDPLRATEVLQEVRAGGIDAKLVMLGNGKMEKQLHMLAKGLPVEFPGWQDPLPYLAVADVVLCTSQHESYGASIVEALAAGVPVVAPDVGIAKEAGAVVVPRGELASKTIDILRGGGQGVLQLPILSRQEWASRWRDTLQV